MEGTLIFRPSSDKKLCALAFLYTAPSQPPNPYPIELHGCVNGPKLLFESLKTCWLAKVRLNEEIVPMNWRSTKQCSINCGVCSDKSCVDSSLQQCCSYYLPVGPKSHSGLNFYPSYLQSCASHKCEPTPTEKHLLRGEAGGRCFSESASEGANLNGSS